MIAPPRLVPANSEEEQINIINASPRTAGEVPVLESHRLILRGHTRADFPSSAALWADENVVRYIGGNPSTQQQSWSRFLTYAGHWKTLGFGYWLIEEKASRRFVGEIGFADYHRAMTPPIAGLPEAGWALAPSAHGKGYATEALLAILGWGNQNFTSDKTVCFIHPDNLPSRRVAEKCGYSFWCNGVYQGQQVVLMSRPIPG